MGITEFLAENIMAFFESTGYFSVFILMAMESMIFPVPSEAVMPPAGLLISQGRFTFAGVVAASTAGSIFGSILSYWIGQYGGRPFIDRYGKYFLLDHKALDWAEKYFAKKGDLTILICRFIPVVRHIISIPAGMGKMNLVKFSIYTIIGAAVWNGFLAYIGMHWGQAGWDWLMKYSHPIDIAILILLVIGIAYFIFKHIRRK
jgi:membrane protein DedA with SNARE-associated domain